MPSCNERRSQVKSKQCSKGECLSPFASVWRACWLIDDLARSRTTAHPLPTTARRLARQKAERKAAAIERSRQRQQSQDYFAKAKAANERGTCATQRMLMGNRCVLIPAVFLWCREARARRGSTEVCCRTTGVCGGRTCGGKRGDDRGRGGPSCFEMQNESIYKMI